MKKKNDNFNKIIASTITASVVASALVTVAPNANAAATNFKDVQSNDFFYEAVNSLHARNIFSGYNDGTFRPNETVTRAQAAKVIAIVLNLDTTNMKDPGFKDVSKKDWAYKYIAALANKGIVVGSDGEYKPNNPITRAQMAKVISLAYNFQAEDSQQISFTDVSQDDWFKNYVGALVGNQITSGTTPTTFSPHKNVTRGQIAAFVYRSENKINPVQVSETISTITNDTLVTTEGTYILSGEQKKWINPSNLATLKGAILKLASTDNKIEQIQSIELTAKGTVSTDTSNPYANHVVFDGKGATIDSNFIVNGDYTTLKNTTIKGDFHIGKGVENSFFSEFTKVEGKTTIDDSSVVARQTKSYQSSVVKIASTNNFAAAVNETTTRGRIVFSEFQLGDVGVDKNADVIFQSKTSGTSKVGEIVVNSNATLTAESSVVLPKVIIAQGATDVTLHSNVTNLHVTTSGNVKLSGKSNIVNLSLIANAIIDLQTIGRVNNLETVNKETKVTIGTETKIGNLIIPTGSKPADIIGNYNSVKGNVEQVGGTKNPDTTTTAPSTGNSGSGAGGTTDTTAPVAVMGVVASSLDANSHTIGGIQNIISWNANTVSDLSYYEVYRSTNPNGTTGATKVSSNLAKGVTTFTDTSVVAGTTYYYTVYAVDTSGNRSASSNVAMVSTVNDIPVIIPAGPIGLQGVSPTMAGTDGKITGLDVTKTYQYKLSTHTSWTNVPLLATEITDLSAGNYEVRFATNENLPASLSAIVTVPSLNQSQVHSNIQVMNYARSGEDLIAIFKVPVASTIKVYDASTNGKIIGSFSVNADNDDIESNAIISISEGFAPGLDKVYVTITESGKTESERVEKEVPITFPDAPALSDITVTHNPNGDVRVTVKVPSLIEDSHFFVYDVSGNQLPWNIQNDDNGANSIVIPNDYVNGMSEIDIAIVKVIDDGTQFVESFRTRVNISAIESLNVEAAADTQSNDKTVITAGIPSQGNEFAYKVFDDVDAANDARPTLNADVSSWKVLPQDGKISAANGKVVVVVERTTVGQLAKKVGQVNAVTGVVNPLLEAVVIDGKDGVSSQDGKVETVRLKFSEKFNPGTVLADDMFSVDGFNVESIKVTDKNGRTPKLSNANDNPLYTQGESQYITIRVEQRDGTDFTPQVTQKANSSFTDINGVNITGIDIQAEDHASPVIISSEFMDTDSNGVTKGDKTSIKFSEKLISDNLTDLVDDFAISNQDNINFTFANDDSFELNGDTVTVTLGSTTVSKMEQNTTITMNADGTISLADSASASNKAKPQKEYVNETVYSTAITIDIINIPAPNLNPPATPTASKALGTDGGTIKLTGLTDGVTYDIAVDENATTSETTGWELKTLNGTTEIDNINVNAGQYVHIRVAKIGKQPASDVQDLAEIELTDITPALPPAAVLVVDSAGFTKLTGLNAEETYEYFVDNNPKATADATKWLLERNLIENSTSYTIQADSSQYIHIRVKATEDKPASEIADVKGSDQIQDSPTQ